MDSKSYGMNYDTDRSSSSEEDPSFLEMCIADGTPSGIPETCFCQRKVLMKHETSGEHKGRAYYACNPNERGAQYHNRGPHFRKWWDYSITEEVKALKQTNDQQTIRIHRLEEENGKKSVEIEDLKRRLVDLEVVFTHRVRL